MKPNESYEPKPVEAWIELAVTTSQEAADVLSNRLMELGASGTVSEDLPATPASCVLKAYYPLATDMATLLDGIRQYLEGLRQLGLDVGTGELRTQQLAPTDWNEQWKQFFKPLRVGKHVVIKPTWEPFEADPADVIVEIDPGMAFGTGLHASTRLCLSLLEEYVHPADDVLDVGTGSGILSIAAARLGARYVLGLDTDAEALDIARENVRANARRWDSSLETRIELQVGSLDSLPLNERFECIVMNIRPNVIVPLIPYAENLLQTGGAVILSGILEEEGPDLLHELRPFNLLMHKQVTEDGWIAYVLSQVDHKKNL